MLYTYIASKTTVYSGNNGSTRHNNLQGSLSLMGRRVMATEDRMIKYDTGSHWGQWEGGKFSPRSARWGVRGN